MAALAWTAAALAVDRPADDAVVPAGGVSVSSSRCCRRAPTRRRYMSQSIAGRVSRAVRHPPELFLNWTGDQAVTVSWVLRIFNAGFAVLAVALMWRRPRPGAFDAACVIALVAVIAPLGWGHTYVMVLPLIVYQLILLKHAPFARGRRDLRVRSDVHDSSWSAPADRSRAGLAGKRRVFAVSDCHHGVNADQ